MFRNMKIGNKLLIGISGVMAIIFVIYTAMVVTRTSDMSIQAAEELAHQMASTYGNQVKNNIEKALDASVTTAAAFVAMTEYKDSVSRDVVDEIQKKVTLSDDTFYGIQAVFEPNALDGKDTEYAGAKEWYGKDGGYGPYFWRSGSGNELLAEDLLQYDPSTTRAWYKLPRDTRKPVLTEPYYSKVAKTTMATVSVPMLKNGQFIGIVGIDFLLSAFQQMVDGIKPMGTGYATVVSNKGYCVAHPNKDMVTKNISEAFPEEVRREMLAAIEKGETWEKQLISPLNGVEYLYEFEAIQIAGTTTPWAIGIAIPTEQIFAEANEFLILSVGLAVGAIVTMILLILLIVRSISRPIQLMVAGAEGVAGGDFSAMPQDTHFSGELLTLHGALSQMVGDLAEHIKTAEEKTHEAEVKTHEAEELAQQAEQARLNAERARSEGMLQAAGQLEGIVERVSSASQELASRIDEAHSGTDIQRQRSTEAATAMEEMNVTVLEVAQNAGEAADSAEAARQNAEEGSEIVRNVVESIDQVHSETTRLEEGLNKLGEQAEGIGSVMNVITDIADQTNLLALNAAIEAARAGEAGRGFAVVADEVRKLAEKTMQATKEVGDAVNAIQAGTAENIKGMQGTARTVNSSTELASSAGEALQNIMSIVVETADQVRAIATASEEQSAASEQITRGTDEVNRIATETAESMAMSADAVNELTQMADELNRLIDQLKQG